MNVLPKTTKDFARKEYWDHFFKQQQNSFEWYGTYDEIKSILLRYIKLQDHLLIVGCGNSTLSVDLYDDGYRNNTSIDISEVVIKKMSSKYKCNNKREQLAFECMDIFNMRYDNETFNIVLDKGTLDALSSDSLNWDLMFSEISRVIKPLGRYVCVTLLQENIVRNLLMWFTKSGCWIVRIHRCPINKGENIISDSINFPVFIVVCTKLKASLSSQANCLIEIDINGDNHFQKLNSIDEVCEQVKSMQEIEFLKYFIRNNKIKDDNFFIELFGDDKKSNCSRYILYFVQKANISGVRCSVFIVPQGREHEWLFSTPKGRENLLKQCQSDRLIVVHLSRKHIYENMEQIKQELSAQVTDFFPIDSKKINFLSIGEDIGQRNIVYEGNSEYSGDFIVEDVTINDEKFRRLLFANNKNVIQSETKLKTIKSKKKKLIQVIDNEYLSCDHHRIIAASLSLANRSNRDQFTLLLVGLGGGCFVNFLANNLKLSQVNLRVIVVEIDPAMHDVAKKLFDFQKSVNRNVDVDVVIDDGLKFIENKVRNQEQFDFIVFDVDSKDLNLGISCPPKEFVEESFLNQVQSCLTTTGIFILNLVARNEDIKQATYHKVKQVFPQSFLFPIEEDLNEIIICSNEDDLMWAKFKSAPQRLSYIQKSDFHMNILSETYEDLCKKSPSLLN